MNSLKDVLRSGSKANDTFNQLVSKVAIEQHKSQFILTIVQLTMCSNGHYTAVYKYCIQYHFSVKIKLMLNDLHTAKWSGTIMK